MDFGGLFVFLRFIIVSGGGGVDPNEILGSGGGGEGDIASGLFFEAGVFLGLVAGAVGEGDFAVGFFGVGKGAACANALSGTEFGVAGDESLNYVGVGEGLASQVENVVLDFSGFADGDRIKVLNVGSLYLKLYAGASDLLQFSKGHAEARQTNALAGDRGRFGNREERGAGAGRGGDRAGGGGGRG